MDIYDLRSSISLCAGLGFVGLHLDNSEELFVHILVKTLQCVPILDNLPLLRECGLAPDSMTLDSEISFMPWRLVPSCTCQQKLWRPLSVAGEREPICEAGLFCVHCGIQCLTLCIHCYSKWLALCMPRTLKWLILGMPWQPEGKASGFGP